MASGGSTGRPKLIEAGGDSRFPAAAGYPLGAQEGDVNLISVPLSHNTGFTTFAVGLVQGHHLVLMPRFEPHEFLALVTEHRVTFLATVPTIMQRLLPVYRAEPGRLRPVVDPPVLAPRRAVPTRDQTGVDRPARPRGGLGTVRRHRTSGADVHLRRSVADPPRLGGRRRRRRDEGPRRRRQRMPARRERRDLHAAVAGQRRRPTATSARPRRAATAGTRSATSATSTPTASSISTTGASTCSPSAAATSTPPRSSRRCALTRTCCPAWSSACPTTTWVRCRTRSCRPTGSTRPPSSTSWPSALPAYKVPRTVEFIDTPLRDDAGKARRSAVRDEVIARLARARS